MAIKPAYANVELDDGRLFESVRVIYADRLAFERTAKARRWDPETQPFTTAGFLAWAALRRSGLYAGTYDQFLAAVVDVQLDDKTSDPDEDADSDPTRTARSDEP